MSPLVGAVVALLSLASATPASEEKGREGALWAAVSDYAHGERGKALSAIASWGRKDFEAVGDSIAELWRAARKCLACEARERFERLPLRAAILLLAERDRVDRLVSIKQKGGDPDCSPGAHDVTIEDWLRWARLQTGGAEFSSRFLFAWSLHQRSTLCFWRARLIAEAGLKTSPRDALLHMAQGLADESLATLSDSGPLLLSQLDQRSLPVNVSGQSELTARLSFARASFERAIQADPGLHEARLRYGRVVWRLGRSNDAIASLRQSVAQATGPILYLAHLFLGKALEDADDIDGAVKEYAAAVSLQPKTQIGAIALGHALFLRGEVEPARALIEGAVASDRPRLASDPYATYLVGAPSIAELLFERLKGEAAR